MKQNSDDPNRGDQALRESEARTRAILDAAVDAIITIDERGLIESVNPAAERLFGFPVQELLGQNVRMLMPSPYREEHDGYLGNYLTTGEKKIIGIGREVMGQRKDGSTFPMHLGVSELWLGKRRMFTGIARDITDVRNAVQQLKDSEARTRAILDAAVDAILTIDEQGTIESLNPAAERLFGFPAAELIGQNVNMLMPSPFREEHDDYLKSYLTTGVKKIIGIGRVVEGRRKNGTTFPMHLAVSELRIGQRRMFTGIARDMTNVQQTMQKLEESEARTRAILQTAVDAVITIDQRGNIESLNPMAETLFGYSADELIGQNVKRLMPSPFYEEHDQYLQDYQRTGIRKIIGIGREVVGLRKDGSTFPMELAVSEFYLGGERHFTGIVRDITARKQQETQLQFFAAELQSRNAELTRSNEELERFTYTVSHDLKSPLVTIKGFLGRLEKNLESGDRERMASDMSRINNAADRMRQLLEDLLELSRIGRIANPHENVSLVEVAQEVVELCGGPINERKMKVLIDPNLPTVRGDRVRLREALQNLVENAVKFTTGVSQPLLEIGCQGTVCFVRDNGAGIAPQYQNKVFGLFEQLSRDFGGSGIGLALVKRIIETHGGQIWIESEGLGQGCKVCFTLTTPME